METKKTTIDGKFELTCSECGRKLKFNVNDNGKITVEPCQDCLDKHFQCGIDSISDINI